MLYFKTLLIISAFSELCFVEILLFLLLDRGVRPLKWINGSVYTICT
jgi:hypothetical protein